MSCSNFSYNFNPPFNAIRILRKSLLYIAFIKEILYNLIVRKITENTRIISVKVFLNLLLVYYGFI
nr:MAG TPA: hypothetical protein [Bacteriophage sp.]